MLTKAILIATQAHAGQFDKGGNPYIFHPLRVMMSLADPVDQICGVLHDVIEDTDITLEHLRNNGLDDNQMLEALDLLTRKQEDTYDQFIDRVLCDPIACRVKLADLKDNMDMSRIKSPSAKDYERVAKYRKAVSKIEQHLNKID